MKFIWFYIDLEYKYLAGKIIYEVFCLYMIYSSSIIAIVIQLNNRNKFPFNKFLQIIKNSIRNLFNNWCKNNILK